MSITVDNTQDNTSTRLRDASIFTKLIHRVSNLSPLRVFVKKNCNTLRYPKADVENIFIYKMNVLRTCTRGALRAQRLTIADYTAGRRGIARWVSPTIKEIVRRKKRLGPQPEPMRSGFLDWNHNSEMYAFNARLSEKFDSDLLLQAFTFRSYIVQEEEKQRAVGITDPKLDIQDNTKMVEDGQRLTEAIIKAYLCQALPRVPEEGIYAVLDYLMSQEVVAKASKHIGTTDLILSADHPVPEETVACTFFALVSALAQSANVDIVHVANFVRDFLIASLSGKDLNEIWCPDEAEAILNDILVRENRELAEPRLIGQAGASSLLAVYHVAFYSNKEFIGKGFGETVEEARHAAAMDALNRMFGLGDSGNPIKYNLAIDISSDIRTENLPITQWCTENVKKIIRA